MASCRVTGRFRVTKVSKLEEESLGPQEFETDDDTNSSVRRTPERSDDSEETAAVSRSDERTKQSVSQDQSAEGAMLDQMAYLERQIVVLSQECGTLREKATVARGHALDLTRHLEECREAAHDGHSVRQQLTRAVGISMNLQQALHESHPASDCEELRAHVMRNSFSREVPEEDFLDTFLRRKQELLNPRSVCQLEGKLLRLLKQLERLQVDTEMRAATSESDDEGGSQLEESTTMNDTMELLRDTTKQLAKLACLVPGGWSRRSHDGCELLPEAVLARLPRLSSRRDAQVRSLVKSLLACHNYCVAVRGAEVRALRAELPWWKKLALRTAEVTRKTLTAFHAREELVHHTNECFDAMRESQSQENMSSFVDSYLANVRYRFDPEDFVTVPQIDLLVAATTRAADALSSAVAKPVAPDVQFLNEPEKENIYNAAVSSDWGSDC